MMNLRLVPVPRDEEDTDEGYAEDRAADTSRLDRAAELADRSPGDLVERLLAPKSTQLGVPCEPFNPRIQLEAARVIKALEDEDPELEMTNEQIAHLALRLMGFYAVGPLDSHGTPEFGFRSSWTDELGLEAGGRICALAPDIGERLGVGSPDTGARPTMG